MGYTKLAGCAAATALGCMAMGQVTSSPQGYLFRAKYTKGTVSKYVVKAVGGPKGNVASVSIASSERVLSVNSGVGTIEVTLGKSVILKNGKPLGEPPSPAGQKETVKLDILGKSADQSGVALQTHIEFNSKPIKVGGAWNTTAAVPFGGGFQMVNATYKLAGIVTLGGKRAAKLTSNLKGSGQADLTGSGVAWISVEDGSLIKESITLKLVGTDTQVTVLVTRT